MTKTQTIQQAIGQVKAARTLCLKLRGLSQGSVSHVYRNWFDITAEHLTEALKCLAHELVECQDE